MKISHRMVIIITLVVSASCIFGIDYYDKKDTKISDLYTQINLPEITYEHIGIELNGTKHGEILDAKGLAVKEGQSMDALSHQFSCSKLCTQVHAYNLDTEIIKDENVLGILAENKDDITPFSVSVKSQKDIGYNTYYKVKIQGLKNINQIDNIRSRSISLLQKWRVKPKEKISFTGSLKGELSTSLRRAYVNTLLRKLNASYTGFYQDDYCKNTEAYYAYTKGFKDYIKDEQGRRTNVQISFSYNEVTNKTQIVIAFPFYNEPF